MFSPNLSNRGKAAFVVGIVVVVSLFWLIGPKSSSSQDSREAEKAVKAAKGGVKGQGYKMAGNVEVRLSKETKLLSPPLPSEVEARKDSIAVTEGTVKIDGVSVFYREAKPGGEPKLNILLLHGQAFTSKNWLDLGTLSYLAAMGNRAVAIDIPGYGKSVPGEVADPVTFMTNLISSLNLGTPIIISPSMSGKLSLPFLTAHPEKVKGYIPVAPVFTGRYSSQYPSIQVPTVIVYGDKDQSLGPESLKNLSLLPNHCAVMLEDARHPAYLDQPQLWHNLLYNFLSKY